MQEPYRMYFILNGYCLITIISRLHCSHRFLPPPSPTIALQQCVQGSGKSHVFLDWWMYLSLDSLPAYFSLSLYVLSVCYSLGRPGSRLQHLLLLLLQLRQQHQHVPALTAWLLTYTNAEQMSCVPLVSDVVLSLLTDSDIVVYQCFFLYISIVEC